MVALACIPGTWEVEAEESRVQGHFQIQKKSEASRDFLKCSFKNE